MLNWMLNLKLLTQLEWFNPTWQGEVALQWKQMSPMKCQLQLHELTLITEELLAPPLQSKKASCYPANTAVWLYYYYKVNCPKRSLFFSKRSAWPMKTISSINKTEALQNDISFLIFDPYLIIVSKMSVFSFYTHSFFVLYTPNPNSLLSHWIFSF